MNSSDTLLFRDDNAMLQNLRDHQMIGSGISDEENEQIKNIEALKLITDESLEISKSLI